MNPIGLIIMAIGVFAIAGGRSDWPWFWNNSRARRMTSMFGRRGAGVAYVVLGVTLVLAGLFALFADVNAL